MKIKSSSHPVSFSRILLKLLIGVAVAFMLSGCMAGMVSTSQNIPSTLTAKEYNNVASMYMDRPTFLSIDVMLDGSRVLTVKMNSYDLRDHTVNFYAQDAPKYIAAIDKFLEWEATAMKKGDMLEKEIAIISTPNGMNISLVFTSGNPTSHFLSIGFTIYDLLGKTTVPMMTFDREGAEALRKLLVDLPTMSTHVQADDYK